MFLLGLGITLVGFWSSIILLGGDDRNFIDMVSLLIVLTPIAGVLTATKSFKVFYAGLRAAIFTKEEITEDMRGQAATLFRLLSKVAVMAGGIGSLISLVNLLMHLDFSHASMWASLGINISTALLTLLYGLLIMGFVFEPIVFILKKRSQKHR